jgi:signal transduction histidine kinase
MLQDIDINVKRAAIAILGLAAIACLYALSIYNYLVFHAIVEVAVIIVAGTIFLIAWRSRKFLGNSYLLFIGIAYLFVGVIELIHILAYRGMGVFPGGGTNLPTQIWLAARFMESISLVLAALIADKKLRPVATLTAYAAATALILLSIFYWGIFPVSFVEGSGLTPFKIYSEYAIIILFFTSLVLLRNIRERFDKGVYRLLSVSIGATILAELAFTGYESPYDILNFTGHIFLLASFYLMYKAIIVTAIDKPHYIIFRSLKEREGELEEARSQAELYVDLMSHDINNMNQVGIGNLELALMSGDMSEDTKALLTKALESLENSSRLISNVRKLQGAPTTALEPIDLGRTLEDVSSSYSDAMAGKAVIRYQRPSGYIVMANGLLRDVFSNLVENAVKHSGHPVEIDIDIKKITESGKPCYRVSIQDNGPGIPDEQKARLFQRLYRGRTKVKGSGLGLYLVKTLVEYFKGRVWVEDRVPGDHTKGSRFVVTLPAAQAGQ